MTEMDSNDLFSASLEAINTDKRVEKYQRFKNDFQRECFVTLDNAQEWIKAELPMVTEYIDAVAIKDELKQGNASSRRKFLLSALLFEKSLRQAIEHDNAAQAAMMALHMVNEIWQAKVELHGLQPVKTSKPAPEHSAVESFDDTREKILTTLIKKGEKLKQDSQIQTKVSAKVSTKAKAKPKPKQVVKKQENKKKSVPVMQAPVNRNNSESTQQSKKPVNRNVKPKVAPKNTAKTKASKLKEKSNSVFSKVKTKLPLKRKNKYVKKQAAVNENQSNDYAQDEDLFDDPNQSAIMVSPGFADSIDDSIIKARDEIFKDPNNSSVTVHKVLKGRQHEKQKPGMQTVVMKLASSTGKRKGGKLSIPEQCQDAINILSQQFPGYDMVAIRNMAAEKVGVSPQYIENLNILPE
ncbi:MAG: hypothetical protein AAF304_07225 [Pseudomonadota bacterium]